MSASTEALGQLLPGYDMMSSLAEHEEDLLADLLLCISGLDKFCSAMCAQQCVLSSTELP